MPTSRVRVASSGVTPCALTLLLPGFPDDKYFSFWRECNNTGPSLYGNTGQLVCQWESPVPVEEIPSTQPSLLSWKTGQKNAWGGTASCGRPETCFSILKNVKQGKVMTCKMKEYVWFCTIPWPVIKFRRLIPQCIRTAVKHGGGNIHVWGCFAYSGGGLLLHIDYTQTRKYHSILQRHAIPSGLSLLKNRSPLTWHLDPTV